MPKLQCSAVHCEYNRENRCCLPNIQVGGGHEAKVSRETCCDSFMEKNHRATNQAEFCHCNTSLRVGCTATNCVYNANGMCEAKSVQIGNHQACSRNETLCDTFSCGAQCGCR